MDDADQKLNLRHSIRPFPTFAGALERIDAPPHGIKLVEVRLGNFSLRYARIDRRVVLRSPTRLALLALLSVLTAGGLWVWYSLQPVVAPAIRIVLQGSPSPPAADAAPLAENVPAPKLEILPRPVAVPPSRVQLAGDNHKRVDAVATSGSPVLPAEPDHPQSRDADFAKWESVRTALREALVSGEVQDWTEDAAFGVVVPGPLADGSKEQCRSVAILKRQDGRDAETRSGTGCLNASGAVTLSR